MCCDQRLDRGPCLPMHWHPIVVPVIFKKEEVPLIDPVDLSGGAHAVGQAENGRVLLCRRAMPLTVCPTPVPMRVANGEALQVCLHFTLFPAGAVGVQNKEVRGMADLKSATVLAQVGQLDRWRLVPELQDGLAMLIFENRRQLIPMTFKLDRAPHLAARVTAADIPDGATHAAAGFVHPNLCNDGLGTGREVHGLKTEQELLSSEHTRAPHGQRCGGAIICL